MAGIGAPRALGQAQRQFKDALKAMRTDTAQQARTRLLTYATLPDGSIPVRSLPAVQEAVGPILSAELVAGRNAFAADGATPLTPYAEALTRGMAQVTVDVVRAHHRWLRANVPLDVFRWLARPSNVVSEQFTPNPLAEYEPAHTFVDPNGYVLSDRIWLVNARARVSIDQLLAQGINAGDSAVNIAPRLERWLIPGRAPFRTRTPYGRDGSYDALRLARTEITAAHGRAMLAAARSNPYAEAIDWRLSPQHPQADICDDYAEGGPYALNAVPGYPPHPHCLCHLVTITRPIDEVTDELRAMIEAGEPAPYVTPANEYGFLVALLGPVLMNWLLADGLLT